MLRKMYNLSSCLILTFLVAGPAFSFQKNEQILSQQYVYRGDVNGDQEVNVTDAVYLLKFLFSAGPAPFNLEAADVNQDGYLNLSDPIIVLKFLFEGRVQAGLGEIIRPIPIMESDLDPAVFSSQIILKTEDEAGKIIALKYFTLEDGDQFVYEVEAYPNEPGFAKGYKVYLENNGNKELILEEQLVDLTSSAPKPPGEAASGVEKIIYALYSADNNVRLQLDALSVSREEKDQLIKNVIITVLEELKNSQLIQGYEEDLAAYGYHQEAEFYLNFLLTGINDFNPQQNMRLTVPKSVPPRLARILKSLDQKVGTGEGTINGYSPHPDNYLEAKEGNLVKISLDGNRTTLPSVFYVDLLEREITDSLKQGFDSIMDAMKVNFIDDRHILTVNKLNDLYQSKVIYRINPQRTKNKILEFINGSPPDLEGEAPQGGGGESGDQEEQMGAGAAASSAPYKNVKQAVAFQYNYVDKDFGYQFWGSLADLKLKTLESIGYDTKAFNGKMDRTEYDHFINNWKVYGLGGLIFIETHGAWDKDAKAVLLVAAYSNYEAMKFDNDRFNRGGIHTVERYSLEKNVFSIWHPVSDLINMPKKDIVFLGSCMGLGFVNTALGGKISDNIVYQPNINYASQVFLGFTSIVNGMTGSFGTAKKSLKDSFEATFSSPEVRKGKAPEFGEVIVFSLNDPSWILRDESIPWDPPDPGQEEGTEDGEGVNLGEGMQMPGDWYLLGKGNVVLEPYIYDIVPWGDIAYKITFSVPIKQDDITGAFTLEDTNDKAARIDRDKGYTQWLEGSDNEAIVSIKRNRDLAPQIAYYKIKLLSSHFVSSEAYENGSIIGLHGREAWDNELIEQTMAINGRELKDGFRGYRHKAGGDLNLEDDYFFGFIRDIPSLPTGLEVGNYATDNPF